MSPPAPPGYTIAYDGEARILHLTLSGLWSMATLAMFGTALLLKVTALKMRRLPFDMLSDSRGFAVQTTLVSQGFERMMAHGARTHVGHVAIVVGSVLNKLQAERTLGNDRTQVFLDLEEAKAWLVAQRQAVPTH